MKNFFIITLIALFQINTYAQPKQQSEKAFVAELNNILKNTKEENEGFKFDGEKIIEQEFAINEQGILSLIIRYNNRDGTFYKSRMEAPINKIQGLSYDLYLILEFDDDAITWHKTAINSSEFTDKSTSSYLHIGVPWPEDIRHKENLQKLLNELLKYYKN
ncbi:hypothetical protein ACM55F_11610 [Flavobacterium sp. XS2P12]|uniref:hypothetical protein n=1 Tax=Flavobacterium melibiosi TaxID=3398734 RepID=UPI003A8C0F25